MLLFITKMPFITLQDVTAKHNYAILICGGVPMHTNSRLQTMSAVQARRAHTAQRGKTNTQRAEAKEMGPAIAVFSALMAGTAALKWPLIFWAALGIGMWLAYKWVSVPVKILLVIASAMTALTAAIPHVFSVWF